MPDRSSPRRWSTILNADISPIVPEYGSLGASGDLAPLAHGALALLGEGDVVHRGEKRAAADALRDAGLEPIELAEKEGLAVTNGTDAILGMLCLAIVDIQRLLAQADMIAAMTIEGLLATDAPFAADLQALRPQPGQAVSAANLRTMLAGSPIVASHATPADTRVQDAYSIRCTPSVHGAVRDTLAHCRGVAEHELAAAIDNPMVLPDGRVESCGNFHGAPLGFAADFLAIAVAEIGAIAERRMDRMLDQTRSHGLPPFLADEVGVDSGMMIGHYTAAAMASENKRLAAPGIGRLAPDVRDAGGPRVDGMARRAQTAQGRRQRPPDPRGRVHLCGAGDRSARPTRAGRGDRRPGRVAARRGAGAGTRPLPRPGTRGGGTVARLRRDDRRARRRRRHASLTAGGSVRRRAR